MDAPDVVAAIARLKLGNSETEAKQLLHVRDDHAFFWNGRESNLAVISLRKDIEGSRVQTFHLTDTPSFEVERVISNASGRLLCLYGRQGVTCIELPRRSGKGGRFGGGQAELTCRSFGVAERSFTCLSRLLVQQAQFHPGSLLNNHLVVLTSNNQLQLFNVDRDHQVPEQVIPLGPSAGGFFAESALSVKGSIGETAVGFAFAPPVTTTEKDEEDEMDKLWPLFVLNGNGDVFCLVTTLGDDRPECCNKVLGPLTMYPDSADNYGVDSCAILCLHPMISSPPLLVIATSGGTLYHCIVLNKSDVSEEDDDVQSQESQWSTSTFKRQELPQLGLYVYESIELEVGLTTRPSQEKKPNELKPFEYPMLLHEDPTTPARYFCSHKAGVHCVGLPMVTQISEMAQQPDSTTVITAEQESVVEHLICTQMSAESVAAPVLGVAVHYPPTSLLCLLSDGRVQTLNLAAPYFDSPPPLLSKSVSETGYQSPLKNKSQGSKEPFDQKIKMILKKGTTLPIMKGGTNAELKGQDCLDIVTRSTQILREEYLLRLDVARSEIERRIRHLSNTRQSQMQSLTRIEREKTFLRDKAADLSERYEDLKDNGDKLRSRIEVVLEKIQCQAPGLSDAEFQMQRKIKDLERRSKDLSNAMEQIRSKERYQLQQIELARKNAKRGTATNKDSEMGENQLNSIKEVLQGDSQEIAELVKKLNLAKKDLAT